MLTVLVTLKTGSLAYEWRYPGELETLPEDALQLPLERLLRAEVTLPLPEELGVLEALVGVSQGELSARAKGAAARVEVEGPSTVQVLPPG